MAKREPLPPIQWKDPPAPQRGGIRAAEYDDIVEQLQQRPGNWALIVEDTNQSPAISLKRRGCEVRRNYLPGDRQRFDLYARWPISAS